MITPKTLPQEIVDMLLPRLRDEYNAAYLYRAASNWCQGVGFTKAAAFFAAESADELAHAKIIEDYLTDWNVIPELPQIEQPKLNFTDLINVIETAYKTEYVLYEEYEDTSMKVFATGDVCTFNFLAQFNDLQRRAVAEYSDKINILEGVSGSKFELLMLEESLFNG